nr:uncharacterized protein LOC126518134 [Dermacentor andersoni]
MNATNCLCSDTARGYTPGGAAASSDSETSESNNYWTVDGKGASKTREGKLSKKTARKKHSSGSEAEKKSGSSPSSKPEQCEVLDFGGGSSAPAGDSGSEDDGDVVSKVEFSDSYDENLMGA